MGGLSYSWPQTDTTTCNLSYETKSACNSWVVDRAGRGGRGKLSFRCDAYSQASYRSRVVGGRDGEGAGGVGRIQMITHPFRDGGGGEGGGWMDSSLL